MAHLAEKEPTYSKCFSVVVAKLPLYPAPRKLGANVQKLSNFSFFFAKHLLIDYIIECNIELFDFVTSMSNWQSTATPSKINQNVQFQTNRMGLCREIT